MIQLNDVVKSLVKFLDNMDKSKRKKYLSDLGFRHCKKIITAGSVKKNSQHKWWQLPFK